MLRCPISDSCQQNTAPNIDIYENLVVRALCPNPNHLGNRRLADCSRAVLCYVTALNAIADDLTDHITTIINNLRELTFP